MKFVIFRDWDTWRPRKLTVQLRDCNDRVVDETYMFGLVLGLSFRLFVRKWRMLRRYEIMQAASGHAKLQDF